MARIGIDFGGTQIKIASVDADGTIGAQLALDTPQNASPDAVVERIAEAIVEVEAAPEAIGLAIPGQVDALGRVYRLPNVPGFERFPLAAALQRHITCPVVVENDGNAAAHGEALFGAGQQYRSFAMITLGTGIGAGIVIDGRVRTGAHGFAAELGHLRVDNTEAAELCGCGRRGCVEAYAGTRALLREFQRQGAIATEILPVADSARRGESAGKAAFAMMARGLAGGITALQTLLDLDAIVFTGGISRSFDLLEQPLRQEVRGLAYSEPLGEVPLVVSALGASAGVIGASHLDRLLA